MPRFSANLSMLFDELPFPERFAAARAAGFDAVECQFPYAWPAQTLARALREHSLEMVLHNLPAGDWDRGERGIACHPDRVDEFRAGVARGIEYAQALGCERLNCLAGIVPEGVDRPTARRTLIENLRHAASALEQAGIQLLIEPINHFDIPGFLVSRSAEAVQIIDDAGCANLFLQYDIYHAQRMEGELANTIVRLLPRIAHMQLADNPGRHEPGSGEIRFDFLFDFIDRAGYPGWIGCEYKPLADTVQGLSWLHAWRARQTAR